MGNIDATSGADIFDVKIQFRVIIMYQYDVKKTDHWVIRNRSRQTVLDDESEENDPMYPTEVETKKRDDKN